jgi:hypothetical protein
MARHEGPNVRRQFLGVRRCDLRQFMRHERQLCGVSGVVYFGTEYRRAKYVEVNGPEVGEPAARLSRGQRRRGIDDGLTFGAELGLAEIDRAENSVREEHGGPRVAPIAPARAVVACHCSSSNVYSPLTPQLTSGRVKQKASAASFRRSLDRFSVRYTAGDGSAPGGSGIPSGGSGGPISMNN